MTTQEQNRTNRNLRIALALINQHITADDAQGIDLANAVSLIVDTVREQGWLQDEGGDFYREWANGLRDQWVAR